MRNRIVLLLLCAVVFFTAERLDAQQHIVILVGRDAPELESIQESDYDGPIGILGHQSDLDVEWVLEENLKGLRILQAKLASKQPQFITR